MQKYSDDIQSLPDIEIPEIEIDRGWPVSDVCTLQDCDDAFAFLTSAIATIEYSISLELLRPPASRRKEWIAKATCALKFKKAAMDLVNHKRGQINRKEAASVQKQRDRLLVDHIKTCVPEEQFRAWVRDSGIYGIVEDAA